MPASDFLASAALANAAPIWHSSPMQLPDPLHPAVVHFPIALLIVGGVAAFLALPARSRFPSAVAAVVLTLGTLGAIVARQTGEAEEERLEPVTVPIRELIDDHEAWANYTIISGLIASILAALAYRATARDSRATLLLKSLTATVALLAAFSVYQTGSRGGRLVYDHGIGIRGTTIIAPAPADSAIESDDD